jgi:hypothetical protein
MSRRQCDGQAARPPPAKVCLGARSPGYRPKPQRLARPIGRCRNRPAQAATTAVAASSNVTFTMRIARFFARRISMGYRRKLNSSGNQMGFHPKSKFAQKRVGEALGSGGGVGRGGVGVKSTGEALGSNLNLFTFGLTKVGRSNQRGTLGRILGSLR